MALQPDGSISIADIAVEFGGDAPHGLNEYYDVATGLPVSGTIGLAHFYGTTAIPLAPLAVWTKTWDLATDWSSAERIVQSASLPSGSVGSIATRTPYPDTKLTWSTDGYFMYVSTGSYWLQREVSTPYDGSLAAKVEDKSVYLNAAGNPTTPMSNHLMRKYMQVVNNGNNTIAWYGYGTLGKVLYMDDLATANDITSVSFTTTNFYDMADDINSSRMPVQVQFTQGGTVMYVLYVLGLQYNSSTGKFDEINGNDVKSSIIKYTLSTAWDLTTASTTSTSSYNFSSEGRNVAQGFAMNPDETEFFAFISEDSSNFIMERHEIPTAGDLSSIPTYSFYGATNVYRKLSTAQLYTPLQVAMSSDGKIVMIWSNTGYLLFDIEALSLPPVIVPIGLFSGAYPSGTSGGVYVGTIDQINFSSLGNATGTGSLSYQRGWAAQGSSTRAVFAGASDSGGSGVNTVIEYVTFGTAGNGTDFGDLTVARWTPSSVGNSTRGVWVSGSPSSGRSNVMDYITFATTGNATDFGDIATQSASPAGLSSPTRGVIKAGFLAGSPYWSNAIDYITTATTGNSTDFGDGTYSSYDPGAASSDTRGLFVGGVDSNSVLSNVMEYITIATTGNALDFGDLAVARRIQMSGSSNNILAVFGGSYYSNSLEKITIATLGNGTEFGDLTQTGFYSGCSNVHGGLQ